MNTEKKNAYENFGLSVQGPLELMFWVLICNLAVYHMLYAACRWMKLCLIWSAAGRSVSDMQWVAGIWTRERSCLRAGQASSSLSQTTPPGPYITLYNTRANDICRRTGNHTDLSLIYGLKDRNKSPPRVSLPSHPYPQSPLIALNQWKSGRFVPLVCRLIACSFTCSVFRISQTASIMLMSRWMRTVAHGWADGYCLIISVWTALWGARRSCHRVFVGLSNMAVYNVIQLTWCGWRISGIVADRPDLFSVTLVWLASLSRCLCV